MTKQLSHIDEAGNASMVDVSNKQASVRTAVASGKVELEKIKEATDKVAYNNMVISPLFYAKMRYYDSLTFRMFEGNSLLAMGGIYTIDGVEAAGFALYTDECISNKMNRG